MEPRSSSLREKDKALGFGEVAASTRQTERVKRCQQAMVKRKYKM
jgi:hypothetical protein